MPFPFSIHIGDLAIHPHPLFEGIAVVAGIAFAIARRRNPRLPILSLRGRLNLLIGAVWGALVGSFAAGTLEWLPLYEMSTSSGGGLFLGRSIVGGLLGGWAGVELAKKWSRIRPRTGDMHVFPLIISICIGRIGCFLTGLEDQTHGVATSLPWGVDFGDGVFRHPTQLYEIVFLCVLGGVLRWRAASLLARGALFRYFLAGYFGWRFLVDFIKPYPSLALGVQGLQWLSLLGVALAVISLRRIVRETNCGEQT